MQVARSRRLQLQALVTAPPLALSLFWRLGHRPFSLRIWHRPSSCLARPWAPCQQRDRRRKAGKLMADFENFAVWSLQCTPREKNVLQCARVAPWLVSPGLLTESGNQTLGLLIVLDPNHPTGWLLALHTPAARPLRPPCQGRLACCRRGLRCVRMGAAASARHQRPPSFSPVSCHAVVLQTAAPLCSSKGLD